MKKLIFLLFFALAYTAQAQTQDEYKFKGVAYSDLPITAKLIVKGSDAYLTIKQIGVGNIIENALGKRHTSMYNGKTGYIFKTNKWTILMYDISEELGYESFNIFTGSVISIGQEPPKNEFGVYLHNSLLLQNNTMKRKAEED